MALRESSGRPPTEIVADLGIIPTILRCEAGERTIHGLWNAIGRILDLYLPRDSDNDFAACGYDAN